MEDNHDDSPTPEEALALADSNNDSQVSWDEFWVAWNTEDDHDDHDGHDENGHDDNEIHGDDDHDEHSALEEAMDNYMMGMLMTAFNDSDANDDTFLDINELATFIQSIDDMEDTLDAFPTDILISVFDEDQDGGISLSEFTEMMEAMGSMGEEDHDGHDDDDHGDHDGQDDHGEDGHGEDDHGDDGGMNESEMMELMFNMFDENGDGMVSATELEAMMEMGDDDHDDHDGHDGHDDHDGHDGHDDHDEHDGHGDELVGHAMLEVLAEGDYGFAMPADVEFFIVMAEGGHDDHDDHSGHNDHGDEAGDDHGDEGNHTDEEEGDDLSFDPHSWLDPLAFKEQVKLVLATLVAEYPSMDSKFTDNAEEFMATLDSLDEKFASTFVTGTSCPSNKVAANHNAYSYMAQRYGLEFVTVHGLDPEGEPTAADIVKVVDQINENGITVFFIEEYTSTDAVDSIVQQTISDTMPTGVTVKYLYTMEMAPKDSTDNYASLMEKNFENIKDGLQCTA
jgi:zinc transport system substrate-binding protein